MKIIEKINQKQRLTGVPSATIAFIGDSITQGCFEVYYESEKTIETIYEPMHAYPMRLRELLAILYPKAQVNIVNSGISGDTVKGGLKRLDDDVIKFAPDLVVIGFGANDCNHAGENGVNEFANNLREMFQRVKSCGAEIIYVAQAPYCTKVSPHISDERLIKLSNQLCSLQNEGTLKKYFDAAKAVAKGEGVKVCDLYSSWEVMAKNGVNTTELLANKLNHPSREMHYYMATKLLEKMMED